MGKGVYKPTRVGEDMQLCIVYNKIQNAPKKSNNHKLERGVVT